MKLFFPRETNPGNQADNRYFYIPIIEQIKDYERVQSWSLAEQKNILRKFYSSPELLQAQECKRLSADKSISCYKVLINEQCLQASATLDGFYTAALNFKIQDIESLIVFNKGNKAEYENPFNQVLAPQLASI
ncbi:MAG: hypothetical protein H0U70_08285 [Tatlockia sp.]|nr:hypothetical protein [Tatlockia sp.]